MTNATIGWAMTIRARSAAIGSGLSEEIRRIQQHPDRYEEQHGERVPQRERVRGRLMAHVRLAHHGAGQERAQGERDAEHRRGHVRDAEGDRQHREREQLPRSLAGDDEQQPGTTRRRPPP